MFHVYIVGGFRVTELPQGAPETFRGSFYSILVWIELFLVGQSAAGFPAGQRAPGRRDEAARRRSLRSRWAVRGGSGGHNGEIEQSAALCGVVKPKVVTLALGFMMSTQTYCRGMPLGVNRST